MAENTVLLTLGRLPKSLALARALAAVGCRVVIADPFRWHLCRPSRDVARCYRVTAPNVDLQAYLAGLRDIIAAENVSLVLPVSEEALHVAQLAGTLPPGVRLWSAPLEQLARYHDKLSFVRHAAQRDLAVPETFEADKEEAAELARRSAFVEKPRHSCSGIGLRLAEAGDGIEAQAADGLVQERLEGQLISTLSIVHEGVDLGTVAYRGTVFAGTVAVCFERVDEAPAVFDWVRRFIEDSSYSGFLAFDIFLGEDGVARAIECNPRATSGVHFFEAASLGAALVDPQRAGSVAFSPHRRFQWAFSTLTETYAALLRPREFARRFRELRSARDVVWEGRDPLPFLLMTPMSWEILWPAMTSRLTLGEATQRDIAWFGSAP